MFWSSQSPQHPPRAIGPLASTAPSTNLLQFLGGVQIQANSWGRGHRLGGRGGSATDSLGGGCAGSNICLPLNVSCITSLWSKSVKSEIKGKNGKNKEKDKKIIKMIKNKETSQHDIVCGYFDFDFCVKKWIHASSADRPNDLKQAEKRNENPGRGMVRICAPPKKHLI